MLLIPSRQVVALGKANEKFADIGIGAGDECDSVVDVPIYLLPWIEDYLLIGVVRVQRGNDARDRIVEKNRADANDRGELKIMRATEERLVLPDRLALVVEDGPATADPSWVDCGASFDERTGLCLNLLLDLATEAVGVAEAELRLGLLVRTRSLTCVSRAIVAAKAGFSKV